MYLRASKIIEHATGHSDFMISMERVPAKAPALPTKWPRWEAIRLQTYVGLPPYDVDTMGTQRANAKAMLRTFIMPSFLVLIRRFAAPTYAISLDGSTVLQPLRGTNEVPAFIW